MRRRKRQDCLLFGFNLMKMKMCGKGRGVKDKVRSKDKRSKLHLKSLKIKMEKTQILNSDLININNKFFYLPLKYIYTSDPATEVVISKFTRILSYEIDSKILFGQANFTCPG